jgi:hypothetical protein
VQAVQAVFEFLDQRVYRYKRIWSIVGLVVALVVALGCVGMAVSVVIDADHRASLRCPRTSPTYAKCMAEAEEARGKSMRVWLLFAFWPLLGAVAMFATYRRYNNWQKLPLPALLRERPHELVWLYVERVTVRRSGVTHMRLRVGGVDGRRHLVPMTNNDDIEQALPLMAAALPHATVGYDEEKNARFGRDPQSFRKGVAPGTGAAQPPAPGPGPAAQPPPAWGPMRIFVAPNVPFGHLDHAMRSLGLAAEPPAAAVAPGEPSAAAWSASWARVVYRFDPTSRARSLELHAQDPASLRARVAGTGLPISG